MLHNSWMETFIISNFAEIMPHKPLNKHKQSTGGMFSRSRITAFLARAVFWLVLLAGGSQHASAEFLSLDTIASWGKFPRFCVNTYRWGDHFFNNYDSTYVQGSGYRFNIKFKTDSWLDKYDFRFTNDYRMGFHSRPSTSMGLWLTYMAVSVGYDMNVSKFFNADTGARKRFNFQFNCSLFGAEFYTINDDSYMTIDRIGHPDESLKVDIPFHGFHSESWGVNLYYFFNHRHYSQAAAFSYSKIQVKSSGSLYAGFSYWSQRYDMDFANVFDEQPESNILPADWDYHYRVKNKNYALKIGYAYNWVFRRGWCLGISEAPTIGIRTGYIIDFSRQRTTFSLNNRIKISLIYNHNKRWFFGIIGNVDTNLVYDKQHTFLANNISMEASAGFRFNLW